MSRAAAIIAGALAAATALGAQPEIAGRAPGAQLESTGAARSAEPEVAGTARSTQPLPLGRFFFTPPERAQLDIARRQKKPTKPLNTEEPESAPALQIVTYGGIVRRSNGSAMLWINNRLVDEKEAFSAMNVKGRVRPDGAVSIQVPDSRETITLKVGQSVEVHSGKVAETRPPVPEGKAPAADAPPASQPKPSGPQSGDGKAEAAPTPVAGADPGARRVESPENQRITGTK